MTDLTANLVSALGLAFGATAFMTFSVRSEKSPVLAGVTFVAVLGAMVGALIWAKLPAPTTLPLGVVGYGMGLFSVAGLVIARHLERKHGVE